MVSAWSWRVLVVCCWLLALDATALCPSCPSLEGNEKSALKDCKSKLRNADALAWSSSDPCDPTGMGNISGAVWANGQLKCQVVNGKTHVVEVLLAGAGLGGPLCAEFGKLGELTKLDVSANQLSGNLPNSIASATKLTEVYIDSNQLSGSVPDNWVELTNLETFRLDNNEVLCGTEWLGAIGLPEKNGSQALYHTIVTGGGYSNTYIGKDCDDLLARSEVGGFQVVWTVALVVVTGILAKWALST